MHAFLVQGVFAAPNTLPRPGEGNSLTYLVAAGGAVLFVVFCLVFFRPRKKVDPEEGLTEDLSNIPPPAAGPRHYQLLVRNTPVRLRYVVVAPVGKQPVGKVDSVLEQVFRGLGEVALADKARVRVWPPQLSTAGFAPTFFRLSKRPDPHGAPSRWVLLAGPARAGGTPVLVGLAAQTDAPTTLGLFTMNEAQWAEVLRVENA
jgi:hypothetical protein